MIGHGAWHNLGLGAAPVVVRTAEHACISNVNIIVRTRSLA